VETTSAESEGPRSIAPRRSPRALARIIAGRATDLFAVGLVLMVGLSAGKQIVAWWRVEPASMSHPVAVGADELADWDARAVDVTIGDSGATLSRRIISGDRSSAEQALAKLCSDVSARAAASAEQVSADEAAWLRRIETLPTAIETGDSLDAVYLPPAPLPQAVAVRQVSGRSADGADHRITATAWALPFGEQRWLLYATPFVAQSGEPVTGELALPPGARRILGWSDENGAAVVAFEGGGSLQDWSGYYRKLAQLETQSLTDDSAVLRGRHSNAQWDVQLQSNGDRVTGICWCTPATDRPPTSQSAETPATESASRP
jgi:hypothetical protein